MEVFDLKEVCSLLRVSPRQIQTLRARGDFPPPLKVGRRSIWRGETLAAWLAELEARTIADAGSPRPRRRGRPRKRPPEGPGAAGRVADAESAR